jgi:hypothetical protein
LAQLGIPLRDAELFDIETYLQIIDIQARIMNGEKVSRPATQQDIDSFLL